MHNQNFFMDALVYLSAAVVSVPVAKRLGFGSVLGYLIAGVLVGPFVLGLVGEEGQDVMHFAEFGVVMMLFLIGLELKPSLLWKMRTPILGLGGLQVAITTILFGGVGLLLGLPWQSSLAVGMILALSSTAIVLQTLAEKGWIKLDAGQGSFSVLLFQDIAVIPILAILPLLAIAEIPDSHPPAVTHEVVQQSEDQVEGHGASEDHAETWVGDLPGWAGTLVVLASVTLIVIVGRFLIRPIFRFIAQTRLREIFTAMALLMVIGIAMLMTKVGLSPALGTFIAGVVLAESEYRHELEGDIEPFKGLLLGLFFIAVGASINFGLINDLPETVFGLVGALILIKLLVLFSLGRMFRLSLDQNLLFSIALAQGGEFAFVLFSFAAQNHVIENDVVSLLVVVVALSMALTPLLIIFYEKVLQPRVGTRKKAEITADEVDEENPVIIAGFGHFGNTFGRLLRANGLSTTVLEINPDRVEMLRKLGLKVFYGDASRHDLLHAAGAESAKLLVLAIGDPEQVLGIVHTARKHFPQLTIFARAQSWTDAHELIEAGVEHVYRDNLDSSLRAGVDALTKLGKRRFQSHRAAKKFRKHDEEYLRELAKLRHDKKRFLSTARQRIKDLENILQDESQAIEAYEDSGWDPTTLREEIKERMKKN